MAHHLGLECCFRIASSYTLHMKASFKRIVLREILFQGKTRAYSTYAKETGGSSREESCNEEYVECLLSPFQVFGITYQFVKALILFFPFKFYLKKKRQHVYMSHPLLLVLGRNLLAVHLVADGDLPSSSVVCFMVLFFPAVVSCRVVSAFL